MSVFAGAISTDSRPLPAEAAERLARAIEPYGGNRARLWKSPRAVLVHRQRVSTPEDAYEQQPMAGHAGVLALDGRFDNRDDLIAALALDARSAPLPDGRILLAALERWGDDGPRRLIGDFAFAWWDRVEHRLTLVCDQMGRRVLHYYHGAGMVVFATMVHAVQALPQVPRAIDEAVLASIILDQGLPAERTLYQGIAQVPAGGRVVVRGDVVRVDRYWEPNWSRRLRLKDDDVVEGARELLDRAVAARLRSASPVASFLSGGLDSSAVASTAARLTSPAVLKTITMLPEAGVAHDVPERCYADERPYVEAIVRRHPNITPHFVMAGGVAPDEEDPTRLFLHVGMPLRGLAHIGWFAAATERLRALGVGVVLTGNAGNLTLSWDGERSLADLFRSGRWIRLVHEAACLGRHTGRSIASVLRTQVAAPLAPLPMREMLRRLRGRGDMPWMAANAIAPAFANQHGIPDHFRRLGALDSYDVPGAAADLRSRMLDNFRLRGITATLRGHRGYEVRDPLGDLRLVEFCFALPDDQYLRDGVSRSLARRTLADRLPPEVIHNTRRGRQNPEWFVRMNRCRDALMADLERLDRSPLARHCLDLPRMKAIAADWPADPAGRGRFSDMVGVLARGVHVGQFLRWVERGNE